MVDSYSFAVDVVRTIGERLTTHADDLTWLFAADTSFVEWLVWEAFLACKARQMSYPFCEVVAKPTYASEGVVDLTMGRTHGDLRVGGPAEGANHCWAFMEFAVLGAPSLPQPDLTAAIARLQRLGWKKSAALLVVVATFPDGSASWAGWDRPTLAAPQPIALPNGAALTLTVFDCKRDPADILRRTTT